MLNSGFFNLIFEAVFEFGKPILIEFDFHYGTFLTHHRREAKFSPICCKNVISVYIIFSTFILAPLTAKQI